MNLAEFQMLDAAKVARGSVFPSKKRQAHGGFSHNHIIEKLFAVEISDPTHRTKYLDLFQKKGCAVRIVFEEHKRLVVHVLNCASDAQVKAISILQRRANQKVKLRPKRPKVGKRKKAA